MHKLFVIFGLFILLLIFSPSASANSNNLVISEVQMGGSGSGTTAEEYIAIYNNSNIDMDVTGWCLQYAVYSKLDFLDANTIGCIVPTNSNIRLILPANSNLIVASNELLAKQPLGYYVDLNFAGGSLSGSATGGTIRLVDNNGAEIDKVGYGQSANPETTPALFTPNNVDNKSIQRIGTVIKQDSDNNLLDFTQLPITSYKQGSLYEQIIQVDVCPNIPGLDVVPPIGYIQDIDGNCYEDVCDNIASLQKTVPAGLYKDVIDCFVIEIKITEMLPNTEGSDTGKEYIELYNPTSHDTNLSGYYLQIGPSFSKNYPLPDTVVAAGSYVYITDTQSGVTLPNSTASIKLYATSGQQIDETESYDSPTDDFAWALFADSWRYTNRPTPGSENVELVPGMGSGEDDGLTPCAAGKYRHPETNRCRNIETDEGLKPCAIDQIRNPLTNRCRSIFASDSGLTPCKPGQTRNPETNRCRSATATAATLKPCAANQVRSAETNRCRKKVEANSQKVVDVESQQLAGHSGWFVAGSAGVGLVGYGVAEWRSEIGSGIRRLRSLLGKNPPEL